MTKRKAPAGAFRQIPCQQAEFDAFRRMLTISEGTFSLSVAICNSPALRDHIIKHITSEVTGIVVVQIPDDTLDIFDFVQPQTADNNPRAVFIVNMDRAISSDHAGRVLQGINVSRESWQLTYQCPVVFWLPDHAAQRLAAHARDLWSWVSHHFEFISE
jgi:hypothetical protein